MLNRGTNPVNRSTVTWIVVAESSRARIFTMKKQRPPLQEVTDMTHTESRLHGQELQSDRAGRSFDSAGQGRHEMEAETDIKRKEAIDFARTLARHIDAERKRGIFDKLILIAPPRFLGHLRDNLGEATLELITREIDKNLVVKDVDAIWSHIKTV